MSFKTVEVKCIEEMFDEKSYIIGSQSFSSFRLDVDSKHIPFKIPALVMRAKDGIRLKMTPI